MAHKFKRSDLRFEIPYFHKAISPSRNDLLPAWYEGYISLEKPTLATAFSWPRKHLTREGSSAVAIVRMSPFASSIPNFKYYSNY